MAVNKVIHSVFILLTIIGFSAHVAASDSLNVENQIRLYKGHVSYAVGDAYDLQDQPCQISVRTLDQENFKGELLISKPGDTDPRVLRTELTLDRDRVGSVNKILGYDYAYESVFEMGDVQLSVAKKLKLTYGGKSLKVSVMNKEKDLDNFFNPVYYTDITCEAQLAD